MILQESQAFGIISEQSTRHSFLTVRVCRSVPDSDTSISQEKRVGNTAENRCGHWRSIAKRKTQVTLEELKVTTTNVLITSKDIAKMLEEIDSPAIVGMVDMDQMTYAKETIDDYFDNLGDKLQHIHFNDRGHTVPGDGDFPMKEYYDSIKNRGYDGTVSFEICDRRYYRDPDKAIDDIVAWMKANTNEFD